MSVSTPNILIVDDRAPNREYLTSLLASRGYPTLEAVDGVNALEMLRSNKVDLVLADILMPRMDGYEFVRRLRQEPGLSSVPVILLTAHYLEAKARVLAESFGVSYVITKPVEPSVILDSVARVLERGPAAGRRVPPSSGQGGPDTSHLAVDASRPASDTFTEQHRRLLTDTLAHKADQLEVANARLRGLVSLGRRLASERSPRQLLSLFVSTAGDLVGAAYVLIAIPDLPKLQGSPQAVSNDQDEAPARSFRHIVANGRDPAIVGRISSGAAVHGLFKNAQAFSHTAIAVDPQANHQIQLPEEFRSLTPGVVIAPVATASQRYGLLVFGGVRIGGEPADSIESLAQSMGAVLAVAFENALRHEQIEHHAGELQGEIAERRLAEERIARLNAELETRVAQRTAELKRSHERLRQSERMASLGTLCAGLGHDMGNLLLPIGVHLDLIEANLVKSASGSHKLEQEPLVENVKSIRECIKYIGDLTSGLRLMSLSAEDSGGRTEYTSVREWWGTVQPFLRTALPARIELECILPEEEVAAAISQHRLTQAVFNLIQNAGDAMRAEADQREGPLRVVVKVVPIESAQVTASANESDAREAGDWLELSVSDNGPGMPDDVRRRALEPYFTTKSRRLSTGLGLSLVHGIILGANGHIEIVSAPGNGTTIRLMLPRVQYDSSRRQHRPRALVTVGERRLQSLAASMMKLLGFDVIEQAHDADIDVASMTSHEVWITDLQRMAPRRIETFLKSGSNRRVALICDDPCPVTHPCCLALGTTARDVRAKLRRHFGRRDCGSNAVDLASRQSQANEKSPTRCTTAEAPAT